MLRLSNMRGEFEKDWALIGAMDPYLIFLTGKNEVRTSVAFNAGKLPTWEGEIVLQVPEELVVKIHAYDRDFIFDDHMAEGILNFRLPSNRGSHKLQMFEPKGALAGTIYFDYQLLNLPRICFSAYHLRVLKSIFQLSGLKSILSRENFLLSFHDAFGLVSGEATTGVESDKYVTFSWTEPIVAILDKEDLPIKIKPGTDSFRTGKYPLPFQFQVLIPQLRILTRNCKGTITLENNGCHLTLSWELIEPTSLAHGSGVFYSSNREKQLIRIEKVNELAILPSIKSAQNSRNRPGSQLFDRQNLKKENQKEELCKNISKISLKETANPIKETSAEKIAQPKISEAQLKEGSELKPLISDQIGGDPNFNQSLTSGTVKIDGICPESGLNCQGSNIIIASQLRKNNPTGRNLFLPQIQLLGTTRRGNVGFGREKRQPFALWERKKMKENPGVGCYELSDGFEKYQYKGPTFGLPYSYYRKVMIPKEAALPHRRIMLKIKSSSDCKIIPNKC